MSLPRQKDITRAYWSVPDSARDLLEVFNDEWSGDRTPGIRLIVRLADRAVGKLFMNTLELPRRVAVYGVAVKPEARGHGIATALMGPGRRRGHCVRTGTLR